MIATRMPLLADFGSCVAYFAAGGSESLVEGAAATFYLRLWPFAEGGNRPIPAVANERIWTLNCYQLKAFVY